MIKYIYNKLLNYIFKNEKEYSLENKLFFSSVIVGIVAMSAFIFSNLFLKLPIITTVLPLIFLVYLLFIYYLIRYVKFNSKYVTPTIMIAILFNSIVWIFKGGIDGANILLELLTFIVGLIVVPSKEKKYLLLFFILLILSNFLIQIFKPDIIVPFISQNKRIAEHISKIIIVSFLLFWVVDFLHNHYTMERKKVEDAKQKVEEGAMKLYELNFRLKEINNDKDKFFSIISHDLKSPFSGFLGLTQIMQEGLWELSKEEIELYIKLLNDSAKNLYELLSNLLEWSLMQKGVTLYEPEICPLSYSIQQIVELQSEVVRKKGIELSNRVPLETLITADKLMLNTILRNLISNAIKFTKKGGAVEVGISENTNENICFFVKDSGIGMDKVLLSKMFRINERTSRPGTDKEPSTGLGLLLCKDFIEKHNGKIWVESEVNIGTTFYVSLPVG
ncbi:MAG: HAMP domain-containing sensor histidine kinase [Candidatus Kapabacteria bacterium]|nr:HAMP domain-containing sensor histidine kinase [Candidatus Kapabacteria bacterium]